LDRGWHLYPNVGFGRSAPTRSLTWPVGAEPGRGRLPRPQLRPDRSRDLLVAPSESSAPSWTLLTPNPNSNRPPSAHRAAGAQPWRDPRPDA